MTLIIVNVEIDNNKDYLMHRNAKEHYLFENEIFSHIINVFTVTFEQFTTSLLNIALLYLVI